jgi:hypothetical protein
LKSKNIPEKFYCKGSLMDVYLNSLFGMTLKHSDQTTQKQLDLLLRQYQSETGLLSAEDSLAKTLAQPEKERESQETEADYGKKWDESLAKYDQNTRSWKTHQCSLFEDLELSLETFPKWGIMQDGELWERTIPERLTSEIESGSWLPTPDASERGATKIYDPKAKSQSGRTLQSYVKNFPTLTSYDSIPNFGARKDNNLSTGGRHGVSLRHLVKTWPTPNSRDWKDSGPTQGNRKSPNLGTMAHFSTPTSSEWKGRGPNSKQQGLTNNIGCTGAQLNPSWVELLMGWPENWTDLNPISKDNFNAWLNGSEKYGRNAWANGNWESETERVSVKTPNRVSRLKAIGNGQVPVCAVLAWNILFS